MYRIIGYYICELIEIPRYLGRTGTMVSVSGCFGGTHPRLDVCFFTNNYTDAKERDAYKKLWNLSGEKAQQLSKEINGLFGNGLDTDGRFTCLSDARRFYDSYFSNGNCIIVSVSSEEKYFDILKGELGNNSCGLTFDKTGCMDENELLGFDILGWDIGIFHSFLCNGLQKMLTRVRFNDYGLLGNTFDETAAFSCQIQGLGEPVEWIPCRIGRCI